jgi:metallo-beta-lactamase class B
MNRIIFVFLAFSITQIVFSQNDLKKITITKDVELLKISDNAYVHVSYSDIPQYGRISSNGLVFIDKGKAFLFDTPVTDSLTKDLVTWLQDSMKIEIVGFIPNHWHIDCMGGLGYLNSVGINSYANELTIQIAKSKNLPVPKQGFRDSLILKLNDKVIRCYYLGAGHTLDNIVAWIPSEHILFGGCMVKDLNAKDLGNIADADLKEWPTTISKAIHKFPNARYVIPGHGQVGGIELLTHTQQLLTRTK